MEISQQIKNFLILLAAIIIVVLIIILLGSGKSKFRGSLARFLSDSSERRALNRRNVKKKTAKRSPEQGNNYQTGTYNTGAYRTGTHNTGTYNTGAYRTGTHNTEAYRTGIHNTGAYRTDVHNTGAYRTGTYNTKNTKDSREQKYSSQIHNEMATLVQKNDSRRRVIDSTGKARLFDETYQLIFKTRKGKTLKIGCSAKSYNNVPFNREGALTYRKNILVKFKYIDGTIYND